MSVSPTRCLSVQAGLAAGKSTLGVCAGRLEASSNPPATAEKKRSNFEFINQALKLFRDGERRRILGVFPHDFQEAAAGWIFCNGNRQLIRRFVQRVLLQINPREIL